MFVVAKEQLSTVLDQLNQTYQVIVPAEVDQLTQYIPYENGMVERVNLILDANTTLCPKVLFLPQSEAMYAFKAQGKKLAISDISPIDEKERLIFPLRHCDCQAVHCLDKVFAEGQFPDEKYLQKRANTTIIALACNQPKATCFCESMGINRAQAADDIADVQMYDLGTAFGMEFISEKGEKVKQAIISLLKEEAHSLPEFVPQKIQVDITDVPKKLSNMFYDDIWNEFTFKCLECGTCTFLCPTCYCFDLSSKVRGEEGIKLRTWDSCMFDEYMLMAGGHNPRPGKKERVRNRFLHKLEYFYENYQEPLCVGCGRCLNKCPMNVDIVKFIRKVNER